MIAELNDDARRNWFDSSRCRTVFTQGARALPDIQCLMSAIATFDQFTPKNDPYGERDFGALDWGGQQVFWKIDYYDRSYRYGSEDPADPTQTRRVLTVMLADEY